MEGRRDGVTLEASNECQGIESTGTRYTDMNDLKRDWNGWNLSERIAFLGLGIGPFCVWLTLLLLQHS